MPKFIRPIRASLYWLVFTSISHAPPWEALEFFNVAYTSCLSGGLPRRRIGLATAELRLDVISLQVQNEAQAQAQAEADTTSSGGDSCPDIDDHHGRWEGSRRVGQIYTLTCAPGFEVIGTRGNGTRGRLSAQMTCPLTLQWPEELWCQDIDDCAALKHGCGALGVCIDLVGGYDCNCEEGYPRHRGLDGEIVCGDTHTDQEICAGHTCGAYGVCIDLRGNFSRFEASPKQVMNDTRRLHAPNHEDHPRSRHTYRCECTDGYYDNGATCIPHDCGILTDDLGVWIGSTTSGGQYTLKCPPGASVWGGALREITITCGNQGKWLSRPSCVNPSLEIHDEQMARLRFTACVIMVVLCICSAALAAGLTLGLVSLDSFGLHVLLATEPGDYPEKYQRKQLLRDKVSAERMLTVVQDHHVLLVTLLLFNTIANEALPIFLDELVPSWVAVLVSVTVVLICGEILPAAVFTGSYQFSIAAAFVPFVSFLKVLFWPVSQPISRVLDFLIPEDLEGEGKYNRAELRALLSLHGPNNDHANGLEMEDNVYSDGEQAMVDEASTFCDRTCEDFSALSSAELRMINGAFSLREARLSSVPYTQVARCSVAYADDISTDIIEIGEIKRGATVIIAVDSRSNGTLRVRDVSGGLRTQDLLTTNPVPLRELLPPRVVIPNTKSVLEALEELKASRSSLGFVVDIDEYAGGYTGNSEILGVVFVSDLLGQLFQPSAETPMAGEIRNLPTLTSTVSEDDWNTTSLKKAKRMRAGSKLLRRTSVTEQVVRNSVAETTMRCRSSSHDLGPSTFSTVNFSFQQDGGSEPMHRRGMEDWHGGHGYMRADTMP